MVVWRTHVWWFCVIWWSHDVSSGWSGAQRLHEVSPAWGESPPDIHREKGRTLTECHPPTGTNQLVSMTMGMSESTFCWQTWTWTQISPIRSLHYEITVMTSSVAPSWFISKQIVFMFFYVEGRSLCPPQPLKRLWDKVVSHDQVWPIVVIWNIWIWGYLFVCFFLFTA